MMMDIFGEIMNKKQYTRVLIRIFKRELKSCDLRRGNCDNVARDLSQYFNRHGLENNLIAGYFRVDTPSYEANDFTKDEQLEAEDMGYDYNDPYEMEEFAEIKGLVDELKHIPHWWVEVDDNIIDLTGENQFVSSGLSRDLSDKRYHKIKEWDTSGKLKKYPDKFGFYD
jgi:hypothetical protein